MGQNKRMEGSRYEQLAARYLEQKGMDVLELNYRCRTGEIDIIARDGGYLVFVEVKYRKTKRAGYALEAIDSRKAGQVRRVAAVYLSMISHNRTGTQPNTDAKIGPVTGPAPAMDEN